MKSPFAVEKIRGKMVLDSRGFPTVEVEAVSGSLSASAMAPAGASKGRFEAHDLRDGEKAFMGNGVTKALRNINGQIARELTGMNACAQNDVDKALSELDSTPQKTEIGGNAMIASSMAVAKLGAKLQDKPLHEYLSQYAPATKEKLVHLPMPLFTMLNGGKHAGTQLPVQEIVVEPARAKSVVSAVQIGSELYHTLKQRIHQKFGAHYTNVGENGGLTAPVADVNAALDLVMESAKELGYEKQIKMGIIVAGSHVRKKDLYHVADKPLSARQLVNFYANLVAQYPISLLVDPFAEDDIQGFQGLMSRIGNTHPIVGDDLLVSNPVRIKRVMDLKACNGLDVKLNQIGTVYDAAQAIALAKGAKWTTVVSDRAGETEDTFITDFAVAMRADYLKAGAVARTERVAKWNRLLRIEEELGKKATFGK